MAITVNQWASAIRGMSQGYDKAVLGALRTGSLLAARAARDKFIARRSGPPLSDKLTHRTGTLGRSIRHIEPRKQGDSFVGGISASAAYAKIHEIGGRTRPHIIRPRRGSFLVFEVGGRLIFARRVNHPGSRMPRRPYLRPAIEQVARPEVTKQIRIAWETLGRRHFK